MVILKCFSCREWWIFALNANLSEIREQRQRSTWEFALHRAQDAVSYTDLYYSKLKGEPLSAAEEVFTFGFPTVLVLVHLLKFKVFWFRSIFSFSAGHFH